MLAGVFLLAAMWCAVNENFGPAALLFGAALGFAALRFSGVTSRRSVWFELVRLPMALGFGLFFLKELVIANFRMAWELSRPIHRLQPGIVAVPLALTDENQIALLANLVTLTPGTLSLDVSADRSTLYVHAMVVPGGDAEAVARSIKDGFERRVMRLFGEGAPR